MNELGESFGKEDMNRKQTATLSAIFDRIPPADLTWAEVKDLLEALPAEGFVENVVIRDEPNQRIHVTIGSYRAALPPHRPVSVLSKKMIERIRELLENTGISLAKRRKPPSKK